MLVMRCIRVDSDMTEVKKNFTTDSASRCRIFPERGAFYCVSPCAGDLKGPIKHGEGGSLEHDSPENWEFCSQAFT